MFVIWHVRTKNSQLILFGFYMKDQHKIRYKKNTNCLKWFHKIIGVPPYFYNRTRTKIMAYSKYAIIIYASVNKA